MADGWKAPTKLVVLSGGNPQVPKGDGEAPVRYFLEHMPDWQKPIGKRLDALITKAVPGVQKCVRWNTPMYDAGRGLFVGFHCFTKYVKVTFFRGKQLKPVPPVGSKDPDAAYYHVGPDGMDEEQFVAWVKQAAKLPGWTP